MNAPQLIKTALIALSIIFNCQLNAQQLHHESKTKYQHGSDVNVGGKQAGNTANVDESQVKKKKKYGVDCSDPDLEMLGLDYMCANR